MNTVEAEDKAASRGAERRRRRAAAVVLLAALLIRGGVMAAMRENLRRDPDGYRRIAETLARTGVYGIRGSDGLVHPTAHRPPLYPWVLSRLAFRGVVTPAAVAGLHLALGVATVALTLLLGRRCRLGRWGLLAGVLLACDPILLNQQTLVMTETLAALLAAAALLALATAARKRTGGGALAAGGLSGLAALCRPVFLVFLVAAVPALALGLRGGRRRTAAAGAFLAGALAALAPWIVRNYRQSGQLVIATTHGGYTLLLGNNALFYEHLRRAPWGTVWDAAPLQRRLAQSPAAAPCSAGSHNGFPLAAEIAADRQAYALAWRTIASQPGMFLYASAVRLGRLWGILPHQSSASETAARRRARRLVALWYGAFLALVLLGAWAQGRSLWTAAWFWGVLLCLSFTVVHVFYWSDLRMRAPLTPVLCLLAAAGARRLATWIGLPSASSRN